MLAHAPRIAAGCQVTRRTLGEILPGTLPSFIKPVTPKQFRGAVYESNDALALECRGLQPDTPVFVSEPVSFTAEARTFVMDRLVLDGCVRGKSRSSRCGNICRSFDAFDVAPTHRRCRFWFHRRSRLGCD
jgi:hypothetical protein